MPIEIQIDPAKLPPDPDIWPPESTRNVPFVYALETFVQDHVSREFGDLLVSYLGVMKARGWTRVFKSTEVTGNPRRIAQLWRIPAPFPGPDPVAAQGSIEEAVELGRLRHVHRFLMEVSSFERKLFAPLPYDPNLPLNNEAPFDNEAPPRPTLSKGNVLLIVQACVRQGAMARLAKLKEVLFKPTVEEPIAEHPEDGGPGWDLVAAGHMVSGSLPSSTIVQVWRLPSCNSLPETMGRMTGNGNYKELIAPCLTQETQLLHSVASGNT